MSEQQKKIYEGLDALASKLGSEEREELAGLVRTITTSRPAEATRAAGRWLKANGYEDRSTQAARDERIWRGMTVPGDLPPRELQSMCMIPDCGCDGRTHP